MPLVSIQLNSNRPQQITRFFDSIEATADVPGDVELLLHIDEGDAIMEAAVAGERQRRPFAIRLLKTSLVNGYGTLWRPLNRLWEMTHPDAVFVLNVSDEMLFETKGWDSALRAYADYYPDRIFRLRASQYRFRNYTDIWECGFAPDSIAFYTRRWLELSGGWCPCLGPDSFQQCVAFYMFTSDPFVPEQYNRDIPLPALRFSGEGQGAGLTGEARWRRVCVNIRAWMVLMSHPMQQEAKRCAMRMKAHSAAFQAGNAEVIEDSTGKCFTVRRDGATIARFPYTLSRLRILLRNLSRIPFLLRYNGSRKAGGGSARNVLLTCAASCALFVAAYLPLSIGGKMLARAEKVLRPKPMI